MTEPKWITIGRGLIGTKEIPGVKNNSLIMRMWNRIGALWIKDDETPWCGGFVGYCLAEAGIKIPAGGLGARAATWITWGVRCVPQLGAVGVKSRVGGNHVFFIVGETTDGKRFKCLHGNSGNMVRISDIPKSEIDACRWPAGIPMKNAPLVKLAAGSVVTREA